jgi:hypothetical protein
MPRAPQPRRQPPHPLAVGAVVAQEDVVGEGGGHGEVNLLEVFSAAL